MVLMALEICVGCGGRNLIYYFEKQSISNRIVRQICVSWEIEKLRPNWVDFLQTQIMPPEIWIGWFLSGRGR